MYASDSFVKINQTRLRWKNKTKAAYKNDIDFGISLWYFMSIDLA